MILHLWTIPVLPLIGAVLNGLFGRHFSKRLVATVGLVFTGAAFANVIWVASQFGALELPHAETLVPWLQIAGFQADFGFYLDQLSLVMLLVVTGVGFLIHIYSVGYMAEEGGYYRFFCYMNIFMFFMLTLVLANNYLLMFVGWEGVGLASYLLIGFFFLKDSAAAAGKKAFIVNRIGDFGFLIGLFLLIKYFGTLNFEDVFAGVSKLPVETAGVGLLTTISLLLFVGATGKSAQVPLYVWLPDAMEGPTPVSALIHAATMVTAGVYMVVRSNPLFSRAPIALNVVAIVACITALMAATIGVTQRDIKRVLAYSTISQLGYMFLGAGVAAYTAAIFHLMTHAFFKALLFLGAGSVIHALGGEQDMMRMGGLRKKIPITFWVMTAATFAIAGFPPFAGFFSKDEILWQAWSSQYGSKVFWAIAFTTALITSFYMFRLWFLTFFGEFRGAPADAGEEPVGAAHVPHDTPAAAKGSQHAAHGGASHGHGAHGHGIHESPRIMLAPLIVLAVLSVIGGWVGVPHALGGHNQFHTFLSPVVQQVQPAATEHAASASQQPSHAAPHAEAGYESATTELALTAASVGVAALGFFFAWLFYYKRPDLPGRIATAAGGLYQAVFNKYYVDELYGAVIVRPIVEGSAKLLWRGIDVGVIDGAINNSAEAAQGVSNEVRQMQSGNIRSYAGWVALGAGAIIGYIILVAAK